MLVEVFRDMIEHLPVLREETHRLIICVIDNGKYLLINLRRRVLTADQSCAVVQILVLHRRQAHHTELIGHTVLRYHCPGNRRRLLNIVRRTAGCRLEYQHLRRTSCHVSGNLR